MSKFQITMIIAGVLTAAAGIGAPRGAHAQSPTPTETATVTPSPSITLTPTATCTPQTGSVPCAGSKKVQLRWVSKDPLTIRVFVSGTHCNAPLSCGAGADGDLVTMPPITVKITDAAGHSLSKTVTDPGLNMGGCPGGKDTYRGTDRLRFVYGAATTVVGKLRIAQASPTPPTFTPPITFTVRDGCGYSVEGTVTTCFTKQSSLSTYVKCF